MYKIHLQFKWKNPESLSIVRFGYLGQGLVIDIFLSEMH